MHFLKRSLSFVRFRVKGKFSFARETYQKTFEQNTFRDLSQLSLETDESVGWVSPENCLQPPQLESIMLPPYFKLSMRIDRRRLSSTLMNAHLAIEEKSALAGSGKKKLTREEKQEIKDSVREFLLERAPVTSSLHRALWNFRTATCYLFSTSKNAQSQLAKLFVESFELELEVQSPWSQAISWAQDHNAGQFLQQLEPCSFLKEGDK